MGCGGRRVRASRLDRCRPGPYGTRRSGARTPRGMEPVGIDRTHILVLNYNGRALLEACLPSVAEAARAAPVPCGVTVVDNASTDDSLAYLAKDWPGVGVVREPNL